VLVRRAGDRIEQRGLGERPRRVVDEHDVRVGRDAREARGARGLAGRAALGLCRWFDAHRDSLAPIGLTQDALDCLGHEREPNFEPAPDEVPGHAWWSRGTFRPESPTLAREHAAVTMDMNVGYDTPRYVIFTARPK